MPSQNIQSLFATIRVEQVIAYLTNKGWTIQASPERLDFQRAADASGDLHRLFLPARQSHPKFRHLLPNLVFSLSVIEQREAIDIANDLADMVVATSAEAVTAPTVVAATSAKATEPAPKRGGVRFSLRNTAATASKIRFGDDERQYELPSGQTVHVLDESPLRPCVLEFSGGIRLCFPAGGTGRLLLDSPDLPARNDPAWLIHWLASRLQAVGERGSGSRWPLEEFAESAGRFQFATLGIHDLTKQPELLMRASASLLCDWIGRMEELPALRAIIFDLARLLVALGGFTFQAETNNAELLWAAGKSDSSISPFQTLKWLSDHARPSETD